MPKYPPPSYFATVTRVGFKLRTSLSTAKQAISSDHELKNYNRKKYGRVVGYQIRPGSQILEWNPEEEEWEIWYQVPDDTHYEELPWRYNKNFKGFNHEDDLFKEWL